MPECEVDLSKLATKDWENVCSKKCCAFTAGICAHVLTALSRKSCNVADNLKGWEQLKAATELYDGEFIVSTCEQVVEDVRRARPNTTHYEWLHCFVFDMWLHCLSLSMWLHCFLVYKWLHCFVLSTCSYVKVEACVVALLCTFYAVALLCTLYVVA